MNFAHPAFFWLLVLLLPLAFLALRRPVSRGPSPLRRHVGRRPGWRILWWWVPEFLTALGFVVLVMILAGPQKPLDPGERTSNGLSMVIALDRSGSMGALIPYGEEHISRLEGVKKVTRDFLDHRKDDRFSLVAFARYPETHTPLTDNRQVVGEFLDLIGLPATQEEDGTAIGDAVVLAVGRLDSSKSESGGAGSPGVVILLTDGQNNCGQVSPEDAASLARDKGVTVYAIGLGGEGVVMVDTPLGPQAQSAGVDLDEEGLDALARKTGGRYFRADTLADLSGLYEEIARRETVKLAIKEAPRTELDLVWGLVLNLAILVLLPAFRELALRRTDP